MIVNVGIIGYGLSAKVFHIPYIQATPNFKLKAICQRRATPENNAADDHPEVDVFTDSVGLIENHDVHLVVLCTPPETHLALGRQCLEAGKHVIVEKPFCPTSTECDELNRCAEQAGKLLTVFHNRRWDADFQTVLSLLKDGTLGRILEFESHFDRWSPVPSGTWQLENSPGHGVAFDLGSHLIDQIVFAFGMPKKVTGFVVQQRMLGKIQVADACTIHLHYEGMLATVKCSALSSESKQLRYWIRGDKGSYKKWDEDPQEAQLLSGMTIEDPKFGVEPSDCNGMLSQLVCGQQIDERKFPTKYPETYRAFYNKLADALCFGAPPPVTGKSARDVIYLLELALESARKGCTFSVSS